MTTDRSVLPPSGSVTHFPERPRRTDMQNSIYLHGPGFQTALARHFGSPDTTLVLSETPVGWNVGHRRGLLYPDLVVAFNVDTAAVIRRRGFSINEQGKPPDFVLEIASLNTAINDYARKREGYAAYGIPEYWRFDNTGGDYYPEALAGYRLTEGEYQPITVRETGEGAFRGHSVVLNLDLCWERGQLRFYDPAARRYLLTHSEEAEARIAERHARIAAESRVRRLEEELRRLSP